jgi:hypothetical protein
MIEFETLRKYISRYNTDDKKYYSLKDMSMEWLEGVIQWYLSIPDNNRKYQINDDILCLYILEKQYRNLEEI